MHFVERASKGSRVVFLSAVFILLCYRSVGVDQSRRVIEEEEERTSLDQFQYSNSLGQAISPMAVAAGTQQATFAAGCFWSVELAFQRVSGVVKTAVGYTQGHVDNPTYQQVCSGRTGHAEAVLVDYKTSEVSYEELLEVFWTKHDATQKNRQGNDVGTQYRSGIYYHTEEQETIAKVSMKSMEERLGRRIVTELLPAKAFYVAEDYHQQYLEKGMSGGSKQSAREGCSDPIRCYG